MSSRVAPVGIGLSPSEEEVYVALLESPGTRLVELILQTGLSQTTVRARLRDLERKGFVSRLATRPARFAPAAPEMLLEAHISEQREQLDRVASAARALSERFGNGQSDDGDAPVRVIDGADAFVKNRWWLERSAKQELLVFDKRPFTDAAYDDPVRQDALGRGVRFRAICEREEADIELRLPLLLKMLRDGVDVRLHSHLPARLIVADRKRALLVLSRDGAGIDRALLTEASRLVDVIVSAFEAAWAEAIPLLPDISEPTQSIGRTPLRPGHRDVLILLAAGVKDAVIARHLGIHLRTVHRRVRELMTALGAETRFQLGMLAANHPWVAALEQHDADTPGQRGSE